MLFNIISPLSLPLPPFPPPPLPPSDLTIRGLASSSSSFSFLPPYGPSFPSCLPSLTGWPFSSDLSFLSLLLRRKEKDRQTGGGARGEKTPKIYRLTKRGERSFLLPLCPSGSEDDLEFPFSLSLSPFKDREREDWTGTLSTFLPCP